MNSRYLAGLLAVACAGCVVQPPPAAYAPPPAAYAPPPPAAQAAANCHEFQQTITVGGQTQEAYGSTCQQPDGSWKVMSQAADPPPGATAPPAVAGSLPPPAVPQVAVAPAYPPAYPYPYPYPYYAYPSYYPSYYPGYYYGPGVVGAVVVRRRWR